MTALVLGPLVRYVDEHTASVWVKTAAAARVTVCAGEHEATARTFGVHGHHYALVELDGLPRGTRLDYQVLVDGEPVWPPADSPYPASQIVTLDHDEPLRVVFGSCRTSISHDAAGNGIHGVDALRAYALRMAGVTDASGDHDPDAGGDVRWPGLLLFLGDQVYADETTAEMREFIEARRDIEQPPWTELKDYQEYAHLYQIAWVEPTNRWLLSTVPSAMIFDDHDIRDDWNTSQVWKDEMEATSWWHGRVVAGLAAYWVYQHLGNLSPAQRADDEVWRAITAHEGEHEHDATAHLDALAERADQHPESYRWSHSRDFGSQARLVVIDSRAARVLEPGRRSILDAHELAWLDEQMRGDVDHLLLGTSLPFLLAPGLHYVEAFNEALAGGAWGRRVGTLSERMRTTVDLEHWAAFQEGFHTVATMVLEVARGMRGRAPRTVTFLSGDVHHSYVCEARATRRATEGQPPLRSRVVQAVCSPIRNPMPRKVRFATAVVSTGVAGSMGRAVARWARLPEAPVRWRLAKGPWFDNNLATLEVTPSGLHLWWARGEVHGDRHDRPAFVQVASHDVEAADRVAG